MLVSLSLFGSLGQGSGAWLWTYECYIQVRYVTKFVAYIFLKISVATCCVIIVNFKTSISETVGSEHKVNSEVDFSFQYSYMQLALLFEHACISDVYFFVNPDNYNVNAVIGAVCKLGGE
jgi:hypothetical protein